jgi:hypothetical protein
VVGAGPEFTGVITDVFNQVWDIAVDLDDSSFTVGILERTLNGDGNVTDGANLLDIDLTDLDWVGMRGTIITDVTLSDYICNGTAVSCTTFGGGPNVSLLSFGDHSVSVSMNTMRDGELYTFTLTHVPEPGALALAGLGLLGAGFYRRKRV